MKRYFGYIRVSTAKQGTQGVSLQEQKEAIERHASRIGVEICDWFEERETAAHRGRPIFGQMLARLRRGQADGVVIHKIDRGARNLKDWADLGELIDQNIEVQFANESLDLHSRGGRLSADIQAVVAADYIRNLREETVKGLYGRLKQGFYPLRAPLGYLDCGRGKPKQPDPVQGPLVRQAFDLYATGRYSLDALNEELQRRGLRNRRGGKVTCNGLSTILNNPFYIGVIRIRRNGQCYQGVHSPLVSKSLYNRVQAILKGKIFPRTTHHDFLFRRLFACASCRHTLTAERQKGHVYYRCHERSCPMTAVREESIEQAVCEALSPLQLTAEEKAFLSERVREFRTQWWRERERQVQESKLRQAQVAARLARLTDAFLDGTIDKELFENHKNSLLLEQREVAESLAALENDQPSVPDKLAQFFELAESAYSGYISGTAEEKRGLLNLVTSNRQAEGKNVVVELSFPYDQIVLCHQKRYGDPYRYYVEPGLMLSHVRASIDFATISPTDWLCY